jgi:hypothetical protein
MKLFKSPKGSTEQERALHREKLFTEEHGKLQAEWNARLISSGMDANTVYSEYGRDVETRYSEAQEIQYSNYSRWLHKADACRFNHGPRSNIERNKAAWNLFANRGMTLREISSQLDVDVKNLHTTVSKLIEACNEDTRNGLLAAENDTKQEQAEWRRLQALKEKHLKLVKSGQVGAAIVDNLIDSGHLIPLPIDTDAADALNEATAQLALAFAAGE